MKKKICRIIITPRKHTFRHLLWKTFRTFTLHETPASAFPVIPPQQLIVPNSAFHRKYYLPLPGFFVS